MSGAEIVALVTAAVWAGERIMSWFHKTKQSKAVKKIAKAVVPEEPKG